MVKNHKYLFTPLVLALGVLVAVGLSGCQNAPAGGRFVSKAGVNVESMLPGNLIMLLKVGTQDPAQINALKNLNGYFPNDPFGQLVKQFNTGFKENAKLEEEGLDYEKDVLPMINDQTEFYFALAPKAQSTDLKTPEVMIAMTLADSGKFDGIVKNQLDKGKLKKEDYNGVSLYTSTTTPDGGYIGRLNDVAFMATSLDSAKTAIDNVNAKKDALKDNQSYQRALSKMQPGLAFAFADLNNLMTAINSTSENGKSLAEFLKVSGADPDAINSLESETFSATAEKDGLRLKALILAKQGTDLSKISKNVGVSYLMKKIPAANPVVYLESANLQKSLNIFLTALSQQSTEFQGNLQSFKSGLAKEGIDLDKDVLSFMDKGYAMLLDDSGSVIPNLGIYIDASSNPNGAAKVAGKMDQLISSSLAYAQENSPGFDSFVSKEEVETGKLWKVKLNLDPILAQAPAELSQKLTGQKIELYYGLTADNVLVLALQPDLEKAWGQSANVAASAEFSNALGYLGQANKGVTYLSPNQAILMLDKIMDVAKQMGTEVSGQEEYNQVKTYLTPVKSAVFGSEGVSQDEVKGEAFIHIAQ